MRQECQKTESEYCEELEKCFKLSAVHVSDLVVLIKKTHLRLF